MMCAGFFDFALHDFAKTLGRGGEALQVVEAGIVEIGGGDFFWFAGGALFVFLGFFF